MHELSEKYTIYSQFIDRKIKIWKKVEKHVDIYGIAWYIKYNKRRENKSRSPGRTTRVARWNLKEGGTVQKEHKRR